MTYNVFGGTLNPTLLLVAAIVSGCRNVWILWLKVLALEVDQREHGRK